ncbi:MAG: zinc-regulated TonB-dependent outer membrane receptor [Ectothiorhodospiraceae bacterium]|nr:zinc-regulated TonB-dependent outer membrane receptor [Ectothiorhodospiraceae bacterium]
MSRINAASLPVGLALLIAASGASAQQQQNPTRVGAQDPLDCQGIGTYNLAGSRDRVTSGTAFNPAISVILDGVYKNTFSGEAHSPAGFDGGHDHSHGHDHGHGMEDGFNLRETEFAFSASVDNYFDAIAILAVDGDNVELEEAYITTRSLPAGLQIKAGKFLSDIGYINKQHPHDWQFVDRPLVSEYLFGDHGLQDVGVQLSWLAPLPFYSRFGIEVLQGRGGIANYVGSEEHTIVGYGGDPGTEGPTRLRWRADNDLDDSSGPRLVTAFAKFAPDLGYSHAAQFGLSGGYVRTWQNQEGHSSGRLETWDGDAWFAGVDAVYKYDSGRAYGHGNWVVQGEYFYREIDVDYASRDFVDGSTLAPTVSGGTADVFSGTAKQDGAYLQAIYGFAPRWNAGLRAEALGLTNNSLDPDRGNNRFESFGTSYRYAAQVSFMPTEFSRIRLQTNYMDYADDNGDDHDHGAWSVMLQYNVSLGVHGAHDF